MKKLFLLIFNISYATYASDFIDQIHSGFDYFNKNPIAKINYYKTLPETKEEIEARVDRENEERKDVALNKAEVRDQRYWVNGEWVSNKYRPVSTKEELVDSDSDGYDDYTEFKNGSDPKNNQSFPIIRNGNNKKIFK
jgi:hypothetical protein